MLLLLTKHRACCEMTTQNPKKWLLIFLLILGVFQWNKNLSGFFETHCILHMLITNSMLRGEVKMRKTRDVLHISLHPCTLRYLYKGLTRYTCSTDAVLNVYPSNLIHSWHDTEIQSHQNLGLKQISWAVGNTLLQDHDRVELKKTFPGDIGGQFLSKRTHNSGIWRPTTSIPGQQCFEHILVLSAWKWCLQGASKGNNRMWIITALPQFYLAVKSLGLGIFPYCSSGCITPAPAHFIHAAHTLP